MSSWPSRWWKMAVGEQMSTAREAAHVDEARSDTPSRKI